MNDKEFSRHSNPANRSQVPDVAAPRASDTIAAIATPPGRGGVGILRISGPAAAPIAIQMLGRCPTPRHADYLPFRDPAGELIDQGIAIYFSTPNSFTGEDVLELQGHGGPVVMDRLLQAAMQLGARLAHPGEFSQRAFLNGKLDLAQAEAIADLIDSTSVQAARSALRSLQGEFSRRVSELTEELIQLRLYVEAAIDFPDEEIDFLSDGIVAARLDSLRASLRTIQQSAQQGSLLREGMWVVLAGQPNAGKSSLLNALAGRDSAIVTDIPGTTRDVLREQISIDGMPLHIVDTAGLRHSDDAIEQEGIRRAWAEIERADRILLLLDERTGMGEEEYAIRARLPAQLPVTFIHNKIDLTDRRPELMQQGDETHVFLSARVGIGVDLLRDHLKQCMGFHPTAEGVFSARRRHLDALAEAALHVDTAMTQLQIGAGELLAEELLIAQNALATITGAFSADDLLGRIFSSFCIGK